MLLSIAFLRRHAALSAIIPLTILSASACGDESGADPGGNAGAGGLDGGNTESGLGGQSGGAGVSNGGSAGDSGGGGTAGAAGTAGGGGTGGSHLGPSPVDLGSTTDLAAAGAYVLLAKTGITNVTGSAISGGHVGLSPAAATYISGFSLIADSTNVFSTSVSLVPPAKVYAADYEPPTPSNLTIAVLKMESAYVDAAGRTNPDFLNLLGGNIGGQTLAPGLYTWASSVTIPGDVTISGGADDVWIFQVSNDVEVGSAKNVILGGNAQAKNIFWQVAGQVTIHANAHFEGIILSQEGITLQTSATMRGRALAQTLVALDNNAITAP